ncbi:melanoma inhibitory activity protein 2 isoform X4 [Emydura macquarii macquarii]|uniref:melanoma inhibitory activity protein 2 isoform X4 n=1 Tax=Emydura macquarii macquarii TaxID=1129001 RepID=UPI00352A6425
MAEFLDHRILLLVISFLTSLQSTKLLSEWKKCGDQECETAMSRVQGTKDYIGPDCRYLKFKMGEEIIVYSKLSRKREDLWAGSKGKDFGYFPKDAVQSEDVFITQEVEVQTKETDFLCLDGGEYLLENKDSVLHDHDEESEYPLPYTEQKEPESKMPEGELQKQTSISFQKEHGVESVPENDELDRTFKDPHTREETQSNKLFRNNKNGKDDAVLQEAESSHPLKPAPIQSTWTISGIVGWLDLGSKQDEVAFETVTESVEENTFRSRKIAISDESDMKELNDEDKPEPSGWFQSRLTDLLHFGRENSGLDLLSKENSPQIYDSSSNAAHSDFEHRTTAADISTEEQQKSDSEVSKSSWFNLGLSDVFTFGHSNKENAITKEEQNREMEVATNKNEEIQTSSPQETESQMDIELKKEIPKAMIGEEQNDKKNNVQEILDSDNKTPSSGVLPVNEDNPLNFKSTKNAVESSFTIEVADKLIEPYSSEQDPVSESQVVENTEVKEITQESKSINGQSDISDERKLSGKAPKEEHHMHTALYNERNRGQHSKAITIAPVNAQEKMYNSVKNVQLDVKKPLSQIFFLIQKYIPNNEEDWIYQILLHLNGLDIGDFVKSVFSAMAAVSIKVVAVLPDSMRPGPDLYGFPWEMVICAALVGVFTVLLFLCRSYQSVKSRLYIGREKQLASEVAELLEDKCKVLEKLSLYKKEYEDLELSLKDASLLKESTDTSHIEATCEKLNKSNAALKDEIENLEKELKEEKSKRSEQDDSMAEMQRRMESLENEAKSIQSQVAEAKTTLKVFHINKERLETSVQDAIQENFHLQESEKQLLQEAEGWGERFSELNEQTKMFESSKADMEEALKNKESQVKSLTECLLKMKDWSSAIEEDNTEDNHWDVDIKGETENGELLDDQQKRTIKKLIYAAKLNACLKTLEAERNQVYLKLADEDKAKEELTERIENLQSEQVSLQSENAHFESEIQKLQQKLKVMTELYQENEMKLHRKLTVEERERLQKEEKLSKVDEKINHAAEELNSYRQRAKDLEEELDRTIHSYQSQITSHEKKAHDNWLTARAAERHLNDMRKENAHNRQKLTEMEFKFDLLEKDPYALDVPIRPFGREHSPYGPSPMGRPPSETRAFLSPPTLLEGPLRLSPMLPGGGGRGSRGAGNPAMYEAANERGELSSDRLSDPHRAPSDTGSLSPPWDRDRKIILPPSGQPYNDPTLPPRRPERFYSNPLNSGRLSGPAELRSYNMQSFDKADGQASPENSLRTEPSGNETKDHPNFSNFLNVSDQSLAPESEVIGSGFAPPPLPPVRAPLLPVDPRGPFIRRGPPFPPPPPIGMYGPREYFPRDFAGLPRPSLAMRNPFPLRPFSQYPPQRAGSFLPPPPLENRSELSPGLIHQSDAPATGHPEPQQET